MEAHISDSKQTNAETNFSLQTPVNGSKDSNTKTTTNFTLQTSVRVSRQRQQHTHTHTHTHTHKLQTPIGESKQINTETKQH